MKDKNTDDTSKKHLPLFGVGPVIVYGQFFITGMAIVLSYIFDFYRRKMACGYVWRRI